MRNIGMSTDEEIRKGSRLFPASVPVLAESFASLEGGA
jgi:hypothetical protein